MREDTPMNYTLLIRESPELFAARRDPAKRVQLLDPVYAYLRMLREASVFVGGAGLEPPDSGISFLPESGTGWRVQDGPYAEAKEQLGGLIILSAADHPEAVRWAERCPVLPGRVLELRPNVIPLE